jgi:hypothetical protein
MPWFPSSLSFIIAVGQRVLKWPGRIPAPDSKTAPVNEEKARRLVTTFHPVIQELQQIIEEDADLYMGFRQMFEQIPNDPKYDIDPLGTPQVRLFFD